MKVQDLNNQQTCFGNQKQTECKAISADKNNLVWKFEEGLVCSPLLSEN